jgi:hypothetical protein
MSPEERRTMEMKIWEETYITSLRARVKPEDAVKNALTAVDVFRTSFPQTAEEAANAPKLPAAPATTPTPEK